MLLNLPGWIGISLILLAYFLISTKKTDRSSRFYHLLNLFGSLLLIYDAFSKNASAFLVLNLAWAVIAALTLIKTKKVKKKRKNN